MGSDFFSENDCLPVDCLPVCLQLKLHTGKAFISRYVHTSLETREGKASPGKRPDLLLRVGVGVPLGK